MNLYAQSFIYGILAALFALILEQIAFLIFGPSVEAGLYIGISPILVIAASCEEILKLSLILKNTANLQTRGKIVLSSLVLGIGFSTIEILLYSYSENGISQSFLPSALGIIFIQLATSAFAGYVISKRKYFYFSILRILIINITLHLGYNLAIIFLT